MSQSRLQHPFMQELAATFLAAENRLAKRLSESSAVASPDIIGDELRGLFHGLLVLFDGGTALADQGLITIVDEDGIAFDRSLHERCFEYLPKRSA